MLISWILHLKPASVFVGGECCQHAKEIESGRARVIDNIIETSGIECNVLSMFLNKSLDKYIRDL